MSLSGNILISYGEQFQLLDSSLWEKIMETGVYEGVKFDTPILNKDFSFRVSFSEKHEGFHCGITKRLMMKRKEVWEPILFFNTKQEWQRVMIENSGCMNCDWSGYIANPTIAELYFLLPNKFEILDEKRKLEQVTCPNCGGKLKRFAIWAGEHDESIIRKSLE